MSSETYRVSQSANQVSITFRGETASVPRTCSAGALIEAVDVLMWTRPELSLRSAVELAYRELCGTTGRGA